MKFRKIGVALFQLFSCVFVIAKCDRDRVFKRENEIISGSYKKFSEDTFSIVKAASGEFVIDFFSVFSLLGMLYAGADGNTAKEFKKALHMDGQSDQQIFQTFNQIFQSLQTMNGTTFEIASRMFISKDFSVNPTFQQILKRAFFASQKSLDFSRAERATSTINSWVAHATRDKITNVIDPGSLNRGSSIVLINAIYFKGNWKVPFDPQKTELGGFYNLNNRRYEMVEKMQRIGYYDTADIPELDARMVAIPYKGDRLVLLVILPNDERGISFLERRLESYSIQSFWSRFKPDYIDLKVPKFRIETKFDLVATNFFSLLGIKSVTQPGKADFSKITTENHLYLSEAVQKVFFDVNETGTEAASATYVDVVTYSAISPPIFDVNKPFSFVLMDKETKMPIFTGRKE